LAHVSSKNCQKMSYFAIFLVLPFSLKIWVMTTTIWRPFTVLFNLGSAKLRGSAHSSLGSVWILKLALFLVSMFHQMLNNVSKVPRPEKGWKKHCPLPTTLYLSPCNNDHCFFGLQKKKCNIHTIDLFGVSKRTVMVNASN